MSWWRWKALNTASQVTKVFSLLSAFPLKRRHIIDMFTPHHRIFLYETPHEWTYSYKNEAFCFQCHWLLYLAAHLTNIWHFLLTLFTFLLSLCAAVIVTTQSLSESLQHTAEWGNQDFCPGASERRAPCQPQDEPPQWGPSHPFLSLSPSRPAETRLHELTPCLRSYMPSLTVRFAAHSWSFHIRIMCFVI